MQRVNGYLVGALDLNEVKKKIVDFLESLPTIPSLIDNFSDGYGDDGGGVIMFNAQIYNIRGNPRDTFKELIEFLKATDPTRMGDGHVFTPVGSSVEFTYSIVRNSVGEKYIELDKKIEVIPGYENGEDGGTQETRVMIYNIIEFKG